MAALHALPDTCPARWAQAVQMDTWSRPDSPVRSADTALQGSEPIPDSLAAQKAAL